MKAQQLILLTFYMMLGFVFQFPSVAMRFWLIETVQLTPAQMMGMSGMAGIPWCLKPFIGFVSDSFPIFGMRRLPYIILGCWMSTLAYWCLPWSSSNIDLLCLWMMVASLGTCISDVVCDSILVEFARDESEEERGTIQSWGWGCRAFGGLVASITGGFAYTSMGSELVQVVTGCFPLAISVLFLFMKERPYVVKPSGTAKKLFRAFRNPNIYKPALFLFLMSVTPGYGTVTSYFFENELKFSAMDFTILDVTSYVTSMIGTVIYKRYLTKVSFRRIFFWTLSMAWVLKWSYLVLITRLNEKVGIPSLMFALFDSVILSLLGQCILMPAVVMAAKICPAGVEGSLYASLMSISNLAGVVSAEWGSVFANMYGVDRGHFDNFWRLIVLCNMIDLIPIGSVVLVPKDNT